MTDTFHVRELDPNHPGLNPNLPNLFRPTVVRTSTAEHLMLPKTGVVLHLREVSNPTSGYTPKTEGIADASRPSATQSDIDHDRPCTPPHGIAKRPERYRPAPTYKSFAFPQTMVSPKRPDSRQPSPILPPNNLHTHRMVSQSVPSGTDLHTCARTQAIPQTKCRRSVPTCIAPFRPRQMVSPKRPDCRRSCPRSTSYSLAYSATPCDG